ncbi:GNAT family N-acetyltransferase [Streptomyces sp. NPDC052236]|uniref:GNAT family N-acetyltransferase n=1 Tax=Streptomyces sp. NPDC052236 TaxID=3365686 RepID=UPI0037D6930C
MPHLIAPDVHVYASFLGAMKEFAAEGFNPDALLAHEVREFGATWHEPEVFAAYVARLNADSREESPRPEGWVPSTNLWYVDSDTYLGRLTIRHRLSPFLLELGGHIGYAVRPSARRRGHATAMLGDCLPYARTVGIASLLATCDVVNSASRRVIEANGGVLEDERGEKRRYWIRTGL